MRVEPIADAFRRWGYLQAELDPLGRLPPMPHADLDEHGPADGEAAREAARYRAIYCGSIGVEFMHMASPDRCAWIAARMERPADVGDGDPALSVPIDRGRILRRLAAAELFERFLHRRYVGTKRYSLEGAAALIPLLDAILERGAADGVDVALIGMAHRGRLTVMTQVAGVDPRDLFTHFEDLDPKSVLGSGDVRYHLGATGAYVTPSGRAVQVHLVSNPSHLEAVDPVLMGRARARQERLGPDGPRRVLPINLHGDAAFAGQGIAAETLNLADLRGFSVGGTLHVIVNNLIGFTTEPAALHSSHYASDVAKRLSIPIVHVNGDDPAAVARVGGLAAEYRAAFASDVVVDLIGYRRYGHSEVDDPTTTQPLLYRKIAALPMLWESYAGRLGTDRAERARLEREINAALDAARDEGRTRTAPPVLRRLPAHWDRYRGGRYDPGLEVDTAVPAPRLAEIATRITSTPVEFTVHPKVAKVMAERRAMGEGRRAVDWGMGEALAFGSLLWDGLLVRLSGQDARRGTFNHRHAVLVDAANGEARVPLRHLHPDQGRFDVHDTMLSENAALGFEYGFSRDTPDSLVCWEAQFGDFANGAQVIIDQFLSAGEDKWQLLSGLVLLLPHGYEGQGPEHSSARLERFLQLAAEDNMQVCQPSTAAQYFHLLRRQALRAWRKPLVVMTPKSLLRAAASSSPLERLASGRFEPVLPDEDVVDARRLLFCSGKIAHELMAARAHATTAIIRMEQLYPFPENEVAAQLARHEQARDIVWVQEEPANMGALGYIRPLLQRLAGERHVTTVKRQASASPATGSAKAHALEQETLIALALGVAGRT
jgi:2-oxoglutarate dehydrogenase E1 component